jgi:lambda repressor-like predicted transcriptional regulator
MAAHAPADPALVQAFQSFLAQHAHPPEPPSAARDDHAGRLVREFLDEHGWSARDLATRIALQAERDKTTLTVSRKTIDRVLDGHVPHARCKAAIANAMGVPPWRIWGEGAMPLAHQREQILMAAGR